LRDDVRRQFFFRAEVQRRRLREAGGLPDGGEQFVQINRLGEIIQRAVAHGLDGVADVGVGGDEQNGQRRKLRPDAAQGFQPGQTGHPHVGNHHGKFSGGEQFQRAFAGIGEDGFKALAAQKRIQQTALAGVVVHDEDARRRRRRLARFGWHGGKLDQNRNDKKKF